MSALALMALLSAGQGLLGVGQKVSAEVQRRKAEREFQGYEIPSGVKSMMGLLQSAASQRELPGADITRQRMGATTAQGVEAAQRTARSPSDVLAALQGIYGKQMESEQNLSVAGAQQYYQNQMQLAQGLQTLGSYQTQKWQFNELYPYIQRMSAAGQSDAAGGANISGALNTGINLMGTQATLQHQERMFEDWKNSTLGGSAGGGGFGQVVTSNPAPAIISTEPAPPPYSNDPWTPYQDK